MLAVSFQIVARLILEEEKNPVVFESIMDPDGRVTIRG